MIKNKPEFVQESDEINKEIEIFFRNKNKSGKGIPWFSPEQKCLLPEGLREHYRSLNKFFRKKSWHCGGSIPYELLYNKSNFHLLQNISLCEAVDLAYELISEDDKCKSWSKHRDVLIILKVLKECERKYIQQEHIGGLLLLYLKLCVNVDF